MFIPEYASFLLEELCKQWVGIDGKALVEGKGSGRHINMARKDRVLSADRLSELCNLNAAYPPQIEGGTKVPSLPVLINICNALNLSPDYLLRDGPEDNEVSKIRKLAELWESPSPSHQESAAALLRAVLERIEN